jgi:hypothetical protein
MSPTPGSPEYRSALDLLEHPNGTRWVSFDWQDDAPSECEEPIFTVDSYHNDPENKDVPLYWLGQVLE